MIQKIQKLISAMGLIMLTMAGYAQPYAQPYNNVWAFGANAGLDFNGATPVATRTEVDGSGSLSFASVSDGKGNLLFYTNGNTIWNKNHDTLLNGYLWPPATTNAPYSTISQGALITSKPGNPNQYYVFSLRNFSASTLLCSVVDMTLDNGLGAVVDTLKNREITKGLCQKLAAVPGDSCNIWLVVRSSTETEFMAYNITEQGISDSPVVSAVPGLGAVPLRYSQGLLKFSPDRKRAALGGCAQYNNPFTQGLFVLYDFDPATGIFSNTVLIEGPTIAPISRGIAAYGVEFSPDGTKLYTSSGFGGTGGLASIKQWDLSQNLLPTVLLEMSQSTGLALAPDGKIYFKGASGQYLGRINNPNAAGLAANAADSALELLSGTSTSVGLPNTTVLLHFDTAYTAIDTLICSDWVDGIALHPTQQSNSRYTWDNGDTTLDRVIMNAGTYWVVYREMCQVYVDSFTIKGTDLFTTIAVNGFELSATGGPYITYQWYLNGNAIADATSSSYDVTSNGNYTVEVTDENGCSYLSDVYTVNNYDVSVNDADQVASQISVYPNPANSELNIYSPVKVNVSLSGIDGRLYYKGNDVLSISLEGFNCGIYFLNIYDWDNKLIKVEKVIKH